MSKKSQIARRCKVCPTWTQTVCRHAFGVFWCIKSGDGEGCTYPLDDVAEIWRQGGWEPGKGKSVLITLPLEEPQQKKAVRPVAPKKKSRIQLDLMPISAPPPLSDDDY